jgi:hypothetical protein
VTGADLSWVAQALRSGIIVVASMTDHLQRVRDLLAKFEHPLVNFAAQEHGDEVQVIMNFKNITVPVHTYSFDIHPRDLEHPNFAWTFERQIYDGLHDYVIEMFIRAPHTRQG